MKTLLLSLALILSSHMMAADPTTQAPVVKSATPSIRLQIEVPEAEVHPLGLKLQNLQTAIMTVLIKNNISVQDDPANPLLLLRLKTIEADTAYATFIQLAFYEDAILKRSNSDVMALTWSQASLITTTKEDFPAEVMKTIVGMTESFVAEYQKVLPTLK